MLINSPTPIPSVIKAVPPYEISGSGTPTTGISPMTMAILMKTYRKNVTVTPNATRRPNWLLAIN